MAVKRKAARKHAVKAALSNLELVKARSPLNLNIYSDGKKIGELAIGRGSLYWWGRRKKLWKRIDWSSFSEKMDQLAYRNRA